MYYIQIPTNKCIERLSNKPTTSMKETDKYENAHTQAVAIEFSRRRYHELSILRTFCRLKAYEKA